MGKRWKCIVIIPAYNEEEAVGEVIRQVPRHFHPEVHVSVIVIDDGSTDRTAEAARRAGADEVYSLSQNQGLGAAVRTGLQKAYALGADVAVMIDGDNEYPAWQIPDLVLPILEGKADYVMGSRFMGTIKGMRLSRRLGNYFFTALQTLLLRRRIYDGQSGFRAFSREALRDVEILHDYNYAQVMTLNLVRKGYRLLEVPIAYRVRTTGRSFIKYWPYVKHVLPAMYREMRRPVARVSARESGMIAQKREEKVEKVS
ncbi:hypothetical protein BSNK01_10800 [Bacillaceae bacterium]